MTEKDLIGQKLESVKAEAEKSGVRIRVVHQDGKDFIGTCDFIPERLNVSVKEGKIFKVSRG